MENTQLLPSRNLLELQSLDGRILLPSNKINTIDRFKQCVLRKQIVNLVICLCGCILFIVFLCFLYLGKFLQ